MTYSTFLFIYPSPHSHTDFRLFQFCLKKPQVVFALRWYINSFGELNDKSNIIIDISFLCLPQTLFVVIIGRCHSIVCGDHRYLPLYLMTAGRCHSIVCNDCR